jgi:hypothetical protein
MAVILDLFKRGKRNRDGGKPEKKPEKETFPEFTKQRGPNYWAAVEMKGPYARKPEKSELKRFGEMKEEVAKADIPEDEKKTLLELFNTVKKDDNWDVGNTSAIGVNYVRGNFSKELRDHTMKALAAWRSGKIKELIKEESKSLDSKENLTGQEKTILGKMLEIASEKDDLSAAIILRNYIYYQFDKNPVEEKIEKANRGIEIFQHL